ncbi:uncharacterized protein LOC108896443 [Lates calcarifer]|uniref:Uncharacterized protein LOC108896443 n=1 Tax=Lates calcarifer TaxID=8187 RepID=A0AAJ7QAH2_LATCA|nr:uncharacterized protein LOC108896443 [Lates calcarifer]
MDGWHIFIIFLSGVVSCSRDQILGSVSEVTVRPGDNVTLYCDCKLSRGVYILWYRTCSHENQPALVLKASQTFPRFQFLKNHSSESYDLLIMNITDSDEGLYYCGTEQMKVEDEKYITSKNVYSYGNVTRILLNSRLCPDSSSVPNLSWMMVMFSPALTVFSSFLSFILVYHFCQKTGKEPQIHQKIPDTRELTRQSQDEDMCVTRVVFWAKDLQTHH